MKDTEGRRLFELGLNELSQCAFPSKNEVELQFVEEDTSKTTVSFCFFSNHPGRIARHRAFLRPAERQRGREREGRHGSAPSAEADPGARGAGEQQRQHDRGDRRPLGAVRDASRPLHDGVLRQLHANERQ